MSIKRLIIILLFVITTATAVYAERLPDIEFEKTTIDLGTFSSNNPKQRAVFKFKNTGRRPLFIINVRTGCGCTDAEYPRQPILPGKTGEIVVNYDGTNRLLGPFSKIVTVKTNTPKETVRLVIKGNMENTQM
ncbi:MAG: DUF1573 domain-containing protein [Bacteroidales bacterium]|nr:DUF1573 domain-containing protein [Bacteroidales bacterium]